MSSILLRKLRAADFVSSELCKPWEPLGGLSFFRFLSVMFFLVTTPFLLAKVKELTGGDSLDSNIQLVYNNAALAAKTACELCKMD